jgi:uncharacterized membrane protein
MAGHLRAWAVPPVRRLALHPNRSLSGRGMVLTLLLMSLLTLPFAVFFLLKGAWLILPFAVLQLLAFAAIFAALHRGRGDCDVVRLDGDRLEVVQRRRGRETRNTFNRYWLSVRVQRRGRAPARVWLGSHGRWIEIGEGVGEERRLAFAERLRAVVGRGDESPEHLIEIRDSKLVALEA